MEYVSLSTLGVGVTEVVWRFTVENVNPAALSANQLLPLIVTAGP